MDNCVRSEDKQRENSSFSMFVEFFVENDVTTAVPNGGDSRSGQIQNCFYRLAYLRPVDRIKVIHVERFCLRQQKIFQLFNIGGPSAT